MNLKAALLSLIIPFAATPVTATGSFDEHYQLFQTIQSVGVRVKINDPKWCKGQDGSYHSRERLLNICQDNARRPNREVDWTANDLDTLRHEAHHLLQDCMVGGLGDSQLKPYFSDPAERRHFVRSTLGERQMHHLMNLPSYRNSGAHVQTIELEAFATATVIPPTDIATAIRNHCR